MKLVFISDNGNHHKKINIKFWLHVFPPLMLVFSVVALLLINNSSFLSTSDNKVYNNFNSVLYKLSSLDAEVQRLNALSAYISSKSKLDINDFGLKEKPARGGADKINSHYFESSIVRKSDIERNVKTIENNLQRQKLKLRNLVTSLEIKEAEAFLAKTSNSSEIASKLKPHKLEYDFSKPLKKGYISSPFGNRLDPINGSLRHHNGLDIAAKKGSNVYAIANGFVTFSGKKGAYGNLLEISHSESLKSRYAHLDSFLVKKGQLVRKGDLIGKVGATGRVTGPHLHLEIRENNKIKNPRDYLRQVLKGL